MSDIDLEKYYQDRYEDCDHNWKKLFDDMSNMINSLSDTNERLRKIIEELKHD